MLAAKLASCAGACELKLENYAGELGQPAPPLWRVAGSRPKSELNDRRGAALMIAYQRARASQHATFAAACLQETASISTATTSRPEDPSRSPNRLVHRSAQECPAPTSSPSSPAPS